MKTFPLAPALLLLLPLLSGCHKNTVAGKWQGTMPGAQGSSATLTYTFTEDGKETADVTMAGGALSFGVTTAGTYKVDGANLTQSLTPTSMRMGTRTMPMQPGHTETATAPFTLDGDHLTLTNPQTKKSITLTRVKS